MATRWLQRATDTKAQVSDLNFTFLETIITFYPPNFSRLKSEGKYDEEENSEDEGPEHGQLPLNQIE